jgi:acetate kinase
VRDALTDLIAIAPLHNPPSLDVIDAAMAALPELPHVAVFDTAFHATLSPEARTYPVPHDWTVRWGLRRFGFHGLSHAYGARRAAEMIGRSPDGLHVIVAHLGNGASITAVTDGKSVDTTMGFTPMEGLMMGTRSGSIDPGLLLYLQRTCGISAEDLDHVLNYESGLLGVSGLSSDMRTLSEASAAGDQRASLAIRMFAHRARQAIGALAVTLGRVDVLVFTGGIGEHSAQIRSAICHGLSGIGLELNEEANAAMHPDALLSSSRSPGQILAVTSREDIMMAQAAMSCV